MIDVLLFQYTTNSKPKIVPDESVLSDIDKNVYNPKNHPGIFKPRTVTIPETFIKAVANVLEDYPAKSLIEDGQKLITHLKGKRPPVEKLERKKIEQDVYNKVLSRHNIPKLETEENRLKFQQLIDNKVSIILKKDVYNWKPVNYDTYNALVYLMSRSAAEYAVLAKIFLEISERDPQFKPRSLFDFGSGVGTATWAANLYWKKNIFEYFNVDSSSEMNDLAQILLQSGKGTNKMELRGVFYRQFLPSANTTYDLVISAYTFLELPSRHSRLETILNLWNKTQKYLVVVEQGTNAGFQIINEIRDFILYTKDKSDGYIFSPCPHDEVCPRFMLNDGTPCNFEVHYFTLPIGAVSRRRQEKYSYIVFKKGLTC
jgi:ribosomal protein RSM22 (predicted rRNA methylase)